MTTFIAPGPGGMPDEVVRGVSDIAQLRPHFKPRKVLAGGGASMFRPMVGGGLHFRATIQGLNVVAEHAQAVEAMLPGAIGVIHSVTGRFSVMEAQRAIAEMGAVDTGDTLRSIHARMITNRGTVATTIGPTTFYSPLIEFGLGPHYPYGPRPFMSESFSVVLPHHLAALRELAMVASGPSKSIRNKHYSGDVNSYLSKIRAHLYSIEKQIGDIVPMGGAFNFHLPGQGFREGLILTARALGDIQSVVGSAVGARFVRRLQGKVTGRLVGIGSHTVSATTTVGARISFAERQYNKIALPAMSRFVSQSTLFGGGGIGG